MSPFRRSAALIPAAASVCLAAAGAAPARAQAAPARPPAFAKCAACHNVVRGGPNGIGPNLHGVVGRRAGAVPGYAYSASLKGSGAVWNRQTLDKYLVNVKSVAAAGKMPNVALTPAERQAIGAYLAGLK